MKRLFSQKAITAESATSTKQLLDNTSACLKSLQNLDINTDTCDPIMNYLVVTKLDTESRKQWEMYVSQNVQPNTLPSWNQLASFLETRCRTLEMLEGQKNTSKATQNNTSKQIIKHKSFHSTVNNNEKKVSINTCVMCSGGHSLYQCKQYERLSPEKRTEYVQANRLCFNCLSSSHSVRGCHQSMSCRRCGRRHHTTLHYERDQQVAAAVPILPLATSPTVLSENQQPSEKKNPQTWSQQPNNHTESRVVAHFAKESCQGNQSKLLATALIKIVSSNGYSQLARALIDQGSEVSLITEATVQSLGLDRTPVNGIVAGVGEGETRTRCMVSFNIESLLNPEFSFAVRDAYMLKSLTSLLPSRKPANLYWPELDNLSLADPQYRSPGKIDVILGVDVHSGIIKEGLIKHPSAEPGGPLAQNTELGWILSGKVDNEFPGACSLPISLYIRVNEDELLKKFWEIEREPDKIKKKMTQEEMRCEEIYKRTTMRDMNGRYMVRLPFKSANPECLHGNTREIALKRFTYLEKKLLRNPSLREEYTKAIDDYLIQDHMAPIVEEEQVKNPTVVYAPHHAVVREDKETTKTRLVFDFSCKGKNNVSLNEELLVGPKIQQELRHILMRWRRHPICIVADIKQMYRQVIVQEPDTDLQCILWRSDPKEPIQHFRMKRLAFGTASAPYLAVKSLQTLAMDEFTKYPVASQITLEDYYMDDLLSGCETYEESIEIYEQMTNLMRAGGFEMQKWCSNNDQLLEHIKTKNLLTDKTIGFKFNHVVKVLGISWNKSTDNFEYNLQLPMKNETVTKRSVLSEIARLYDPIGWIAPVIFVGKVFIQTLWKSGLDWDENLPSELLREWWKFRDDLVNIPRLIVPRWLQTKREDHVDYTPLQMLPKLDMLQLFT
ncbi:unnamed protein product [Parnassius mnemosyne]|uniref:Peptidase A2 domain-containing protein n=1 Tax=Parnassius mnemosyne TaxID=213953 RepID=A0AAV1KJS6_9NEOP